MYSRKLYHTLLVVSVNKSYLSSSSSHRYVSSCVKKCVRDEWKILIKQYKQRYILKLNYSEVQITESR